MNRCYRPSQQNTPILNSRHRPYTTRIPDPKSLCSEGNSLALQETLIYAAAGLKDGATAGARTDSYQIGYVTGDGESGRTRGYVSFSWPPCMIHIVFYLN